MATEAEDDDYATAMSWLNEVVTRRDQEPIYGRAILEFTWDPKAGKRRVRMVEETSLESANWKPE